MKVTNKICQILALVTCVVALAFFIFPDFATIVTKSEDVGLTGMQLAFGGSVDYADGAIKMAKSADIWVCLVLTIFGTLFSALTFKFKGTRYASVAVSLAAAIYMLVIALSSPFKFVDTRPISPADISAVNYNMISVIVVTAALFACLAFGVAHLLIADKLETAGTKKLTLPKRIVAFFRDYKSEVKKIVWPNFKYVVKNTIVVLIICAILGVFIWLLDLGLLELIGLILGV